MTDDHLEAATGLYEELLVGQMAMRDVLAAGPVLIVQGPDTDRGDVSFDTLERAGAKPRLPNAQLRLFDTGHPWSLTANKRWSFRVANWDSPTNWMTLRGPKVSVRLALRDDRSTIADGPTGRTILHGPADGNSSLQASLLIGGHPPDCTWARSVVRAGSITLLSVAASVALTPKRSELPEILLEATDAGLVGAVRAPVAAETLRLASSQSIAFAHAMEPCPIHARGAAVMACMAANDLIGPMAPACDCDYDLYEAAHDVIVESLNAPGGSADVQTRNRITASASSRLALTAQVALRLGEPLPCEDCGMSADGSAIDRAISHMLAALAHEQMPSVARQLSRMFPEACWAVPDLPEIADDAAGILGSPDIDGISWDDEF